MLRDVIQSSFFGDSRAIWGDCIGFPHDSLCNILSQLFIHLINWWAIGRATLLFDFIRGKSNLFISIILFYVQLHFRSQIFTQDLLIQTFIEFNPSNLLPFLILHLFKLYVFLSNFILNFLFHLLFACQFNILIYRWNFDFWHFLVK